MGTAIIKMREKGTNTVPDKFRKHKNSRKSYKTLSVALDADFIWGWRVLYFVLKMYKTKECTK